MERKTRLLIFGACLLLFLIVTPYTLLYSLGYRVDFEKWKILATGGIYVKALPQSVNVILDSKISAKTSIFSNSAFLQDLLPKKYNLLVWKEGYGDYKKTLEVKEKEVTKLESIILFKNKIEFELIDNGLFPPNQEPKSDNFLMEKNNLYESSAIKKKILIIKNILAYKLSSDRIVWLGTDGFLYGSGTDGKNTEKLTLAELEVNPESSYSIIILNQQTFVKGNNTLWILNQKEKIFENFYGPVNDIKLSPNGQKLLYYNNHEILFSNINQINEKTFLNRFSGKIKDAFWLGDDYIIFSLDDSIIISETDIRGNINAMTLPNEISVGEKIIRVKDPKIYLEQETKRLYILTEENLILSERLIP